MIFSKVQRAGGGMLRGAGALAFVVCFTFLDNSFSMADELPAGVLRPPVSSDKTPVTLLSQESLSGEEENLNSADPFEIDEDLRLELEKLQKELLSVPKRRRYRFGHDGEMIHDSNRSSIRIGGAVGNSSNHPQSETTFRTKPYFNYDLSGSKTDLKLEYGWSRTYGVKLQSSDQLSQDVTFRFQRKIFSKVTLALNDRFALKHQRVTQIDDHKKLTWDQSHRQSLTYEMSKKLQIVLESDYSRTDTPHESFDQDSNYSYVLSPSIFFQMTPKSRISMSYRHSFSRTPGNKEAETNTNQVRASYAYKLTEKSSATLDVGYQKQDPYSAGAGSTDQKVVSLAYTWQMTPKTGFRLNFSHTQQRAIADSTTTLIRTHTFTYSDSLGLGFSFRPHRKASADFSFNGSESHTKTSVGDGTGSKTRNWTLPFQTSLNLTLTDWMTSNISYTYQHQLTDENELEETRKHTLSVTNNVSF